MPVNSLPNRPLSFNEKEQLAAQAREATPLTGSTVPKHEPSIHAFVLITDDNLYALYYENKPLGAQCPLSTLNAS